MVEQSSFGGNKGVHQELEQGRAWGRGRIVDAEAPLAAPDAAELRQVERGCADTHESCSVSGPGVTNPPGWNHNSTTQN